MRALPRPTPCSCGPLTRCADSVPAVIVPLCLYLVHRHPQPVDDCPCFEDAIAFVSVVMGEFVARWYMEHNGYDAAFFRRAMPGAAWASWEDLATWWSTAAIKIVIGAPSPLPSSPFPRRSPERVFAHTLPRPHTGVLTIFVWRIAAKSFCLSILPPIFRFLAQLFTLPHRRFYTPATDYTSVPPEKGLRPIPSVIDLPRMVEYEAAESTARAQGRGGVYGAVKQRTGKGGARGVEKVAAAGAGEKVAGMGQGAGEGRGAWAEQPKRERLVKHYDADGAFALLLPKADPRARPRLIAPTLLQCSRRCLCTVASARSRRASCP